MLQEMVLIGEIVLQAKIAQRAAERLQATHANFDKIEVGVQFNRFSSLQETSLRFFGLIRNIRIGVKY
ncbi:MAG: hypothetical protein IPK21_03200 [Haliscomenobacter sp.]|nr:hypothetical protein [Haliscomenobacter sp.]